MSLYFLISQMSHFASAVNIYDAEAHRGDSFLPFISFLMFLAGLVIILIAAAKLLAIRSQYHLWFDKRDELPEETQQGRKKAIITGWVIFAVGALLFLGSFFVK